MLKGTAGSEERRVGSSVNPGTEAGRSEGVCVCERVRRRRNSKSEKCVRAHGGPCIIAQGVGLDLLL